MSKHYICADTEGSFVVERLADIAEAAVRHVANVADTDEKGGNLTSAKLIGYTGPVSIKDTHECLQVV